MEAKASIKVFFFFILVDALLVKGGIMNSITSLYLACSGRIELMTDWFLSPRGTGWIESEHIDPTDALRIRKWLFFLSYYFYQVYFFLHLFGF